MQCVNRCVEIAVLLLQPCELGLEFALIFVGHGLLNQNADEICENAGKPRAVDLTFASGRREFSKSECQIQNRTLNRYLAASLWF
jgi:hypothetical protein